MPFGAPGAYWLLLDAGLQLRHTPYDLVAAADQIRATSYPMARAFAEENVLHPPSEDALLERFTQVGL
jgi:hypothetical protein